MAGNSGSGLHPSIIEIERKIRSRASIIAVNSHEEDRVMQAIREVVLMQSRMAQARKEGPKVLYVWSVSQGLTQVWPNPEKNLELGLPTLNVSPEETADPAAVLRFILQNDVSPTKAYPKGLAALYVLKDYHPYVDDHVCRRLLRDAAAEFMGVYKSVVLISPFFKVPTELEKAIAVLDFPLPTAGELDVQLKAFMDDLHASIPCDLDPATRADVIRALQGLTAFEADVCLAEAVVKNQRLDGGVIPVVLAEKAALIKKSGGALEYYPEQAGYEDIGGLDLLKSWCLEAEGAVSAAAADFGIQPPKGVLLVGVPGCGKSLTAKAVAGGKRPLLRLDIGKLFGPLVGQSEEQVRSALQIAEAISPCVMWIDEIEKGLSSGGGELDGGTAQRVLGTLLTWMQECRKPVFVVATANDISGLRPELIGRFSEIFFVDLPTAEERLQILCIHVEKVGRKPKEFNLQAVAEATKGFSGRELERLVQNALRRAFADGRRKVKTDDLITCAAQMVTLSGTEPQKIAQMRAWSSKARPASSRQDSGHRAETSQDRSRAASLELDLG